jgi:hypothetical protein
MLTAEAFKERRRHLLVTEIDRARKEPQIDIEILRGKPVCRYTGGGDTARCRTLVYLHFYPTPGQLESTRQSGGPPADHSDPLARVSIDGRRGEPSLGLDVRHIPVQSADLHGFVLLPPRAGGLTEYLLRTDASADMRHDIRLPDHLSCTAKIPGPE